MANEFSDLSGDLWENTFIPGQATAGTADGWTVYNGEQDITVTGAKWVPNEAVTGAATNNFGLTVQNRGAAGTGTTAITTTKTYASGTNSVAYVDEALTLTTTAADLNVAAGSSVALIRSVNNTGLAMPDGYFRLKYRLR